MRLFETIVFRSGTITVRESIDSSTKHRTFRVCVDHGDLAVELSASHLTAALDFLSKEGDRSAAPDSGVE